MPRLIKYSFVLASLAFSLNVSSQPDIPLSDGPANNTSVGICGKFGDTLSLSDLDCAEITIKANAPITVSSFYFSYYLPGNVTLVTEHIFSNTVPAEVLRKFKQVGPTRVYLQEILAESKEGNHLLGNRFIYLRK